MTLSQSGFVVQITFLTSSKTSWYFDGGKREMSK